MVITVNLRAKWRLKTNINYVWTEDKRLYNLRSGRFLKKTLHGLTPGYWIGKTFLSLDKLRGSIELIPKADPLPF